MSSQVTSRSPKGTFPAAVFKGVWWLLTSLPPKGNLPWLQLRHSINLHKGLSGLVCIGLMMFYDRVTPATCLYTAMHGYYGLPRRHFTGTQAGKLLALSDQLFCFSLACK